MNRDRSIDLMKGLLTVLMIVAHCIQAFCLPEPFPANLSVYINLTTFSGFFFVFGYVNQIAYFRKDDIQAARKKLLQTAINLLFMFYLSALAYRLLVSDDPLRFSWARVFKILIFSDVPTLSEFLLSFFIIALVSYCFISYLKRVTVPVALWIITFCLLFTFIPLRWVTVTQLGLITGSRQSYSFPVIPYLPYFLLGVLFAKHQYPFNRKHLVIAILCSIPYLVYFAIKHEYPSRFPPHIFWLTGAAIYLYLYFTIARMISQSTFMYRFECIEKIGSATLFYLIVSNILLFALSGKIGHVLHLGYTLLIAAGMLFSIYRLQKIIK